MQGVSIYFIYNLHLVPNIKHSFSTVCTFQNKVVSLLSRFRQTNSSQSQTCQQTENRYCFVIYLLVRHKK